MKQVTILENVLFTLAFAAAFVMANFAPESSLETKAVSPVAMARMLKYSNYTNETETAAIVAESFKAATNDTQRAMLVASAACCMANITNGVFRDSVVIGLTNAVESLVPPSEGDFTCTDDHDYRLFVAYGKTVAALAVAFRNHEIPGFFDDVLASRLPRRFRAELRSLWRDSGVQNDVLAEIIGIRRCFDVVETYDTVNRLVFHPIDAVTIETAMNTTTTTTTRPLGPPRKTIVADTRPSPTPVGRF